MSGDNYEPNSVNATLSRIETKLDAAMKIQDEQGKLIAGHADAIASLVQWKWYLTGIASVISIGASKFVDFFTGPHK